MSRLFGNVSLASLFWILILSCFLVTGCGKGAYDEKLDTSIQNVKAGIVKAEPTGDDDEMDDAALMAKYAIDDTGAEDEDEDDEFDDEDEEDFDDEDGDGEDEENPF